MGVACSLDNLPVLTLVSEAQWEGCGLVKHMVNWYAINKETNIDTYTCTCLKL